MATITNPSELGMVDETEKGPGPIGTSPEAAKSLKERVRALLTVVEASLTGKAEKATVADFIRLTQLDRELAQDEQPGKVVITWKESPEIQDSET